MALFFNWNGKLIEEEFVSISPNNRSFKFGDGCFETMKVMNGRLLLADLHFDRLLSSLATLQFTVPFFFTQHYFTSTIEELIKANEHKLLARVRFTVYRGDGGLYDEDDTLNFIIQSWPAGKDLKVLNEKGLIVNIFYDAKISADLFSSIKSNNYLPYLMAAKFAKQNKLDDSILLNSFGRIVESTIANVFIIKDDTIKTPLLTEGCVDGVMRRYLSDCFKKEQISYKEGQISEEELFDASEVFLTNALTGIRWVSNIGDRTLKNTTTSYLYNKFIAPLFKAATF